MTIEWMCEYTEGMSEYIISDVEWCSLNNLFYFKDEKPEA